MKKKRDNNKIESERGGKETRTSLVGLAAAICESVFALNDLKS